MISTKKELPKTIGETPPHYQADNLQLKEFIEQIGYQPNVGIAVLNPKNRLLLLRKSTTSHAPGMFQLPSGKIEDMYTLELLHTFLTTRGVDYPELHESLKTAALIELQEETGITGLQPEELVFLNSTWYQIPPTGGKSYLPRLSVIYGTRLDYVPEVMTGLEEDKLSGHEFVTRQQYYKLLELDLLTQNSRFPKDVIEFLFQNY